jgi:hypothetical protein
MGDPLILLLSPSCNRIYSTQGPGLRIIEMDAGRRTACSGVNPLLLQLPR